MAVAEPVIEAVASTGSAGQGHLLILGVDMTGDGQLRNYDLDSTGGEDIVDDPLLFLAQPDSIIISDVFARQNHLAVNSSLLLNTMSGEKRFTVRGIMKSGGLASAFGGDLAIMDVFAAQKVFGRGRHYDRIDVRVKEGVRIEDCQAKLQALLPGFQVESPATRGAQFESLSRAYAMTADLTSAFALFIGMFIIFNTFSIAIAQRRNEIGILRTLGATRGQIRALFLAESAVAGLLGSCAGLLLGMSVARLLARYIAGLLGDVYGIAQEADEITAGPGLILVSLAIGVATSLIAAVIPAWNAARIDPVQALKKGAHQMLSTGDYRRRKIAAAVALAGAGVCTMVNRVHFAMYLAYGLSMAAALLLAPWLSLGLTRLFRPLLRMAMPVEGTLAADSLIQAPRRTSGAVAALMLSLALAVSLGGLARSCYDSIANWLNAAFNPDLFVTTSQQITARSYRFPAALGDVLTAIPGVDEVQRVRSPRVTIDGTPVMMIAVEMESSARRVPLPVVAGRPDEMYRLAADQKGVIASESLTLLHHYKLGDILDIPSPDGILHLPIVGIVRDYSDQQGSLLVDRSWYVKHWHDDTVNMFRLYLKKGASPVEVKHLILARLSGEQRLFVLENADLRGYVLGITNQWFGLTYIQIAVAVLVAILGIVNTLTVSITDRRRELGVLQAVGAMRFQIRRTIWLEAMLIGAIGLALGFVAGAASLYYGLEISQRDVLGLRLDYEFPFKIAILLVPVILGSALVSAFGPAEAAVRGSLTEALEYE